MRRLARGSQHLPPTAGTLSFSAAGLPASSVGYQRVSLRLGSEFLLVVRKRRHNFLHACVRRTQPKHTHTQTTTTRTQQSGNERAFVTCRDATLFICTARPTPQESFSRAGSYSPTRFAGSVRGPARGLPPRRFGKRAALAAASSALALDAWEDWRDVRSAALLLLPGSGRRTPPPTVAKLRNIVAAKKTCLLCRARRDSVVCTVSRGQRRGGEVEGVFLSGERRARACSGRARQRDRDLGG